MLDKKNSTIELTNDKTPWYKKMYHIIFGKTIPQKLFRFYFFTILIGSLLLYAPFSLQQEGIRVLTNGDTKTYSFWDALFTSCSAFSDTGLTTLSILDTYNAFGQFIILVLIQLGGIGLVTILFLIWNAFRKKDKVNLDQVIILQAERGTTKIGNSMSAIRTAVLFLLIIEIIFAFLMSICFFFIPAAVPTNLIAGSDIGSFISYDSNEMVWMYDDYGASLWCGIFTSISAMNNAGLDIISSQSLAPYRNDYGIFLQALAMLEFIIGGIGFPVIYDYYEKIKHKKLGLEYKISLFSKICLWMYFIVAAIGIISAFSFEYGYAAIGTSEIHPGIINDVSAQGQFGVNETLNKNWCIFFNTMSTRSAGFSTVDQVALSTGTKWTNIILMFIGGSPSSSAGGIRTTTIAIIFATIWSKIVGRQNSSMFRRTFTNQQIIDSFIVFMVGLTWLAFASIIIYYTIPSIYFNAAENMRFSYINVLYEITSAFGTTGLSCDISASMSYVGYAVVIITMFIGQLGIGVAVNSWTRRKPKHCSAKYPFEPVLIG